MFNLFRKELTAEEYGHQLWLYCCDVSENFCGNFGPLLEDAGFIKGANTNGAFADEVTLLHLWIFSCALGVEDRNVLDALCNHINAIPPLFTKIRERYALYYEEHTKDLEMLRRGLTPMNMADAFLRCVGNKKPGVEVIVEKAAIEWEIFNTIKIVKQKRNSVKIRAKH